MKFTNSNLTTHYAYKLYSQPWDSSHNVWLFHVVYFGLCHGLTQISMPQTIYLKPELQSAKHLVSLDAYNFFIVATITEAFSEFIKFKYFQLLITSTLPKLIYFTQSLAYWNLQGIVTFKNELFRYSLLHKHIIVPPSTSIEHFRRPIDHDYPLHALTILHS